MQVTKNFHKYSLQYSVHEECIITNIDSQYLSVESDRNQATGFAFCFLHFGCPVSLFFFCDMVKRRRKECDILHFNRKSCATHTHILNSIENNWLLCALIGLGITQFSPKIVTMNFALNAMIPESHYSQIVFEYVRLCLLPSFLFSLLPFYRIDFRMNHHGFGSRQI